MFALLLTLFVIIGNIHTQGQCGPNAKLTGVCCVGCQTCANPDQQCICILLLGCSCLPGYVRNEDNINTCVAVNSTECRAQRYYSYVQPPTCGANEQFVYCGICSATCTDPCECGRCVCSNGYLRDQNADCILANSTPCLSELSIG